MWQIEEGAMAYKTILVQCDGGRGMEVRLKIALDLADRFGGHIVGLHVRQGFEAPAFSDAGLAISNLAEKVAMASERPVLVVPHVGVMKPPGKTVMLCWNDSREAARAATGALPLLAAADKVIVLLIDAANGIDREEPGIDVAEWLARHGVKVTIQRDSAAGSDVGGVILSRAADHDVDLIVMGIYGHSRMREMVLGGASRTLLASMTAPLLIAH
ncbi:MAG: universal stress protein [Reyranella sp.]|nr:universal stress protein [Reyranella sp.]MDP3160717.1 universal stress protein [Reyranella sp.]